MIRVRRLQLIPALALAVFFGGTGRIQLSAVEESVPAANADVFEGQNLTLKAEVEGGEGPFRYLWFKDYVPVAGAVNAELKFEPLTRSDAGTYWVTVFNDSGSTTSAREVITVRPAKPSRLANVSVVGPASDRLIVGFTLGGSGTTEATEVLARAAGPALVQFGVAGALTDPVLSVSREGQLVATNNDWGDDPRLAEAAAAVGAFPFASASKDSALLLALESSSYTAEVVDTGNGVGVTVMELYDTRPDPVDRARPRLVNISARGVTGAAGTPLTAGFTIQGGASMTVLLRGIGPTLERLGMAGAVADPKLNLFGGPTLISSNDNWGDTGPEAIQAAQSLVGAFALDASSLDAALLISLPPGSYTAQISGSNAGGVALIEVYEVPPLVTASSQ